MGKIAVFGLLKHDGKMYTVVVSLRRKTKPY